MTTTMKPAEAVAMLVVRYGFKADDARRALASWGVRSGGRYSRSSVLAIGRRAGNPQQVDVAAVTAMLRDAGLTPREIAAYLRMMERGAKRRSNPMKETKELGYMTKLAAEKGAAYYRKSGNSVSGPKRVFVQGSWYWLIKVTRSDAGNARNPSINLPRQWTPARIRIGPRGKVQVGFTAAQARKINPGAPGSAFKRCVKGVSSRGGAYDPRAVCAAMGRRKYGAKKFQSMALAGKRRAAHRRKR